MKGVPATYLGRIISKDNFRAFIYNPNGQIRLVRSWEEFEANMQSGVWFATQEDAEASKAQSEARSKPNPVGKKKPRPKPKPKPKPQVAEKQSDEEDVVEDDDSVYK